MTFRNRLLEGLTPEDAEAILPHLQPANFARDEVLIEQGGRVGVIHLPESAVFVNLVATSDGNAVECGALGNETVSGLVPCLARTESPWATVVRVAGPGHTVEAEVIRRQALASPAFFELLMRLTNDAQGQAAQLAVCNALHTVASRFARWLLMMDDRAPGATLLVTQDEIAVALGAQRTTLNVAMGELKAEKTIRNIRGKLSILDRSALEDRSCACYFDLRKKTDVAPATEG